MPRENFERQALDGFIKIAQTYNYPIYSGQGKENRISISGNIYIQFGDLRVVTDNYLIVIEVESAGGVTNLVKYWYCLENQLKDFKKPIILFHIFRQISEADYGSHLAVWDFMWSKMGKALGNERIKAVRYCYRNLEDLSRISKDFEKYLKDPNWDVD